MTALRFGQSKPKIKESDIERGILEFLALKRIFAWKIKTTGTFDPHRKIFRSTPNHYRKGVADIIGIFQGRPFAIEVKSKAGSLSLEQKEFLAQFKTEGGLTLVARSVDDVAVALVLWIKEVA